MRLGLCCVFVKEPIGFRVMTAKALSTLDPPARVERLRALALHNAKSLCSAVEFCAGSGIGCFRVNSRILPLCTHPEYGYAPSALGEDVEAAFRGCGELARKADVRLTFHPDQFVVLSSPIEKVVQSALAEIEYQAEVAEWIGADVINIHAGGAYGDKNAALARLAKNVNRLSPGARKRLTLENDDRSYTPLELFPVCRELKVPFVYDVHHHRCLPDGLDVETATRLAVDTWDREPLFHVSSPKGGWEAANPRSHADYIEVSDFPELWDEMDCTVEVEAKAKELAVLALAEALAQRRAARRR